MADPMTFDQMFQILTKQISDSKASTDEKLLNMKTSLDESVVKSDPGYSKQQQSNCGS